MEKSNVIDYQGLQLKQVMEKAKSIRDGLRGKIKAELVKALPSQVIPRYLRRALWSQDKFKIHKAIKRAKDEGWSREQMIKQVKPILGQQLQGIEPLKEDVQESN